MVRLRDEDVLTREVLAWRGVHLFHFAMSSCSQKVRIVLALKGIDWVSHTVDLSSHQNWRSPYLGVNPRGMVPTLVLDGEVHIESNDIIEVLERRFPEPVLIPAGREPEVTAHLHREDEMHLDLRTLSFRFVYGRTGTTKTPELLAAYAAGGSGTVGGAPDSERSVQLAYYERLAADGITDAACREAAARFREAFDAHDRALADAPYLLGDAFTVVDVAWFVYAFRLQLAGYPFAAWHPRVAAWLAGLSARAEMRREVEPPPATAEVIAAARARLTQSRTTFADVVGS